MAKDNKTLHLVLKRKWWDMIASGEKRRNTVKYVSIGRLDPYARRIATILTIFSNITLPLLESFLLRTLGMYAFILAILTQR